MERMIITLDVPFDSESGEDPPHLWNWSELIDAPGTVIVVSHSNRRPAEEEF